MSTFQYEMRKSQQFRHSHWSISSTDQSSKVAKVSVFFTFCHINKKGSNNSFSVDCVVLGWVSGVQESRLSSFPATCLRPTGDRHSHDLQPDIEDPITCQNVCLHLLLLLWAAHIALLVPTHCKIKTQLKSIWADTDKISWNNYALIPGQTPTENSYGTWHPPR